MEDQVESRYYVNKENFNITLPNNDNIDSRQTAIVSNYAKTINKFTNVACCIAARDWKGFGSQSMNGVIEKQGDALKIRRLTPKEYFRLMGFEDKDIDILIDNGISRTQLYKMAGNSIVVNVVYYIFKELKALYPDLFKAPIKTEGQVTFEDILEI